MNAITRALQTARVLDEQGQLSITNLLVAGGAVAAAYGVEERQIEALLPLALAMLGYVSKRFGGIADQRRQDEQTIKLRELGALERKMARDEQLAEVMAKLESYQDDVRKITDQVNTLTAASVAERGLAEMRAGPRFGGKK